MHNEIDLPIMSSTHDSVEFQSFLHDDESIEDYDFESLFSISTAEQTILYHKFYWKDYINKENQTQDSLPVENLSNLLGKYKANTSKYWGDKRLDFAKGNDEFRHPFSAELPRIKANLGRNGKSLEKFAFLYKKHKDRTSKQQLQLP